MTITETLSAGGTGGGGGGDGGSSSSSWNTGNDAAHVSWTPQPPPQLDGGPPAEWLGNEQPAEGEESEESDEAFIARLMAAEREEERMLLQRLHRQQQQGFREEGQEAGLNDGNGDGSSASGGGKAGRRRQEPPTPPVPLASRLQVFSTPNWAGKPKHYYSFRDVQLGQGQLRFFAPEGGCGCERGCGWGGGVGRVKEGPEACVGHHIVLPAVLGLRHCFGRAASQKGCCCRRP